MTDITFRRPKTPLGVGAIIGESFSIFFGRFILIVSIAFVPSLLDYIISGFLVGYDVVNQLKEPDLTDTGDALAYVLTFISEITADALATVLLVQLVHDMKFRRSIRLVRYFDRVPSVILPLVILSIATSILSIAILFNKIPGLYVGSILLVLLIAPQFWLNTVFCVMAPVIVIEHAGFGGLKRSAALTRGYRWPIVGLVLLANICILPIAIGSGYLVDVVVNLAGNAPGIILSSAATSLETAFTAILVALTYARLREIKEGVSVDQIASVFD